MTKQIQSPSKRSKSKRIQKLMEAGLEPSDDLTSDSLKNGVGGQDPDEADLLLDTTLLQEKIDEEAGVAATALKDRSPPKSSSSTSAKKSSKTILSSKKVKKKKRDTTSDYSSDDDKSDEEEETDPGSPESPPVLPPSSSTLSKQINANDDAARKKLQIVLKFAAAEPEQFDVEKILLGGNAVDDTSIECLTIILVNYCDLYRKYTTTEIPLHSPVRMFGFIRDKMSHHGDREDFREHIHQKFLSLPTLQREMFHPIYRESLILAPPHSNFSDVTNRAKMHELNSKIIPCGFKLEPDSSHMDVDSFKASFRFAMARRKDWNRVCIVKVKNSSGSTKKYTKYNVLKDFRKIPMSIMHSTKFHRTPGLEAASMSMYDALCATMTYKFRLEMALHGDNIDNQGPRLLWHILTRLSPRADRIIKIFQAEILTFGTAFKDSGYAAHTCCTILRERLLDFQHAGGDVKSYYNIIRKELLAMNNTTLETKVRNWENDIHQRNEDKCIINLLEVYPSFVDDIIQDGLWIDSKPEDNQFLFSRHLKKLGKLEKQAAKKAKGASEKSASSPDVTAFMSKVKKQINDITTTTNALVASAKKSASSDNGSSKGQSQRSSGKRKAPPTANPPANRGTTPYSYNSDRWGPDCFYKNEADFKAFFYGKDDLDKTTSYKVDGKVWHWCEHCNRRGNHSTESHRKKPRHSAKVPPVAATPAVAEVPEIKESFSDGEIDWVDALNFSDDENNNN